MVTGLFKGKFCMYAVIAAVLAGAGVYAYKSMQLTSAKSEVKTLSERIIELEEKTGELFANNTILKSNNEVLKGNIDELDSVNKENRAAIDSLLKERNDAQKALARLSASTKSDKKALDKLQAQIKELRAIAGNDAEVAKVLKETIRSIQANRSAEQ